MSRSNDDDDASIQDLTEWLREGHMQKYESHFVEAGFGKNDIKLFVDEDDAFIHAFIKENLGIRNRFDVKKILTFLREKTKQFVRKSKKRQLEKTKDNDDEAEDEGLRQPAIKRQRIEKQVLRYFCLYLDLVRVSKYHYYHTNIARLQCE